MHTYKILENDYIIIGNIKGIKNCVDRINKILSFEGEGHLSKWCNNGTGLKCIVNNGGKIKTYAVVKDNGIN